ncbi:hypothetical protein [Streptomyces stelliscabiei]|uniref:hypothetical protein n=1 Tax=Streptomyces stelliscabiei TaxID=146820 RepID=UPI003EBAD2FA
MSELTDGTFLGPASLALRAHPPHPAAVDRTGVQRTGVALTERIHVSLAPVRHLPQQPDTNRFLL